MDLLEKKISGKAVYEGSFLTLYKDEIELPNGKNATREYLRHPGAACVVPLTDDGYVIMVKQYRYPLGKVMLEIPAGKLDKGEDHRLCAERELKEETGAIAKQLFYLGGLAVTPAYTDEIIHMYLARGLSFGDKNPDEDEFLEVVRIPLAKAVNMVLNGEIIDAKTQTALLKTFAYEHQI